MASVPFEVIQNTPDGVRKAKDHYLYNIINLSPTQIHTSYKLRETVQGHICTDGNAYMRIYRLDNGKVSRLHLYQPQFVEPYLLEDNSLVYQVSELGKKSEILFPEELVHLSSWGFDGIKGKNPIQIQRESFSVGISSQRFGNNFYTKGAHVSGALEIPMKMTDPQRKRLKDQLKSDFSGVNNVGGTLFLESGMKYHPIGIKPVDADFIATRKQQAYEVAQWMGVPITLLPGLDATKGDSAKDSIINFLKFTMYPIAKNYEQEFNRKLFTTKELERGYRVRFNFEGLLRADLEARAKFYRELFTVQAINPNEIRKREKMTPYEGGDTYGLPLASNIKTVENEPATE